MTVTMCDMCKFQKKDIAEEPCISCSTNKGKFELDLSEHDKQIRAEAYTKGATDMEKAMQIIIDMQLKQIKNITDLLPTCDRYKDYRCPNSVDDCFSCMMESLNKIGELLGFEQLKEQNK